MKGGLSLDSRGKALEIARLCLDKKAVDVVVLEMEGLTTFTDYFVICSGESTTQVRAIAGHIKESLAKGGGDIKSRKPTGPHQRPLKPQSIEGLGYCHWVLMDYTDVIVHIFEEDTREYYKLEKLWLDAPRIELDEKTGERVSA